MAAIEEYLKLFAAEASWWDWAPLSHFFRGWLLNTIGATLLYLISGALWCFYIYYLKPNVYVHQDVVPSKKMMLSHIRVSMKAIPLYCVLPMIFEFMIENGWTRCFPRISDVGWVLYIAYVVMYLAIVEFGTYWIHRELHEIKPLYKHLHSLHHSYNKPNTISPFAGMAFHPVDGLLQGTPHVVALYLVPMHLTTHKAILFMQALWGANIHDCIHGKVWPALGAGHHTMHHKTYCHNYGLYTIWMDWMFGTLCDPVEDDEAKKM